MNTNAFSRRNFIKAGALSALYMGTGGLTGLAGTVSPTKLKSVEGSARNVIFLVSDGMSAATLGLADLALRRRKGRPSNWIRLYEERRADYIGLMDTASASSLVTDSAAASSAWGSGRRVNNGSVNIAPDGHALPTILGAFRDAGKSTGLVTTTTLTHATPAGFGANVTSRHMEADIARQYFDRAYDVLLGGGHEHFSADGREDGRDLLSAFEKAGHAVVHSRSELRALPSDTRRLLGTFSEGHLPYSLDRSNTRQLERETPTLAEMTDAALRALSSNEVGFILQVEGGRVDHAAHANCTGGLIYDQIAFDEAIGVVLAFAEQRDDTLVIITTDHGNANPGLTGWGNAAERFDRALDFTYTNDWILSGLNRRSSVAQIRDRIEEANHFRISTSQARALRNALRDKYDALLTPRSNARAVLATIQANYTSINWISGSHTADHVEITALGPGSETIPPFVRNDALFDVMVEAAGVRAFVG